MWSTLNSEIDVGQGINVGHGKFGKNDKNRALNKHMAWKIWQKFEVFWKKRKKIFFRFFILNLISIGPFNKAVGPKAVGPGENAMLINLLFGA